MNVFRFCRWSLAALPVFFMFMACDKLLPTSGNGELVPVKIRSVSVKGYGEASATRSAGGEKRIVGEPIVQDLGGGMLAEITVEEDVFALRAGDTYLADTVKFRVIAVDSDNKVYSYGDYKIEGGAPVLTNNTNLHVLNGVSYNYIFISYNNSALPPAPEEGDDLSNVTIAVTAGSNDLLWQTISNPQPDSDGVPVLNFNDIKHQLARVTLVLDANTGRTITSVVAGSITLNAASSGSFNLTNGTFVSSSGTTNFSGWGAFNQQKVSSNTSTFLESAAAYTFSFAENAVTLSENSTEKQTTAGSVTSDDFTFKAESSYTVTLRILKKTSNKFAGSNIYWGGESIGLTFVPYNESNTTPNPETYYQGVYFKWGSLIGIAAGAEDETYASGSTVLYKPTNTSATPGTARTWTATTGTSNDPVWSDWAAIPCQDDASINSTDKDAHSLLTNPNFKQYKGDICNYINKDYRMPTAAELEALGIGWSGGGEYTWTGPIGQVANSNATGQEEITEYYGTFTKTGTNYVLPASGWRIGDYGRLDYVGSSGEYWSCSAYGNSDAYRLYFGNGSAGTL